MCCAVILQQHGQVCIFARIEVPVIISGLIVDRLAEVVQVDSADREVKDDVVGEDLRRFGRPSAVVGSVKKRDFDLLYVRGVDTRKIAKFGIDIEGVGMPQ